MYMARDSGKKDRSLAGRISAAGHNNFLISAKTRFSRSGSIVDALILISNVIGERQLSIPCSGCNDYGTGADGSTIFQLDPVQSIQAIDFARISRKRKPCAKFLSLHLRINREVLSGYPC